MIEIYLNGKLLKSGANYTIERSQDLGGLIFAALCAADPMPKMGDVIIARIWETV